MAIALESINPQLDPRLKKPHTEALLSLGYNTIEPSQESGIVLITPKLGYSVDLDIEPRPDEFNNSIPQEGITAFASILGIDSQDLLTPYPFNHTNRVIVVEGPGDVVFVADEGRTVPYDRNAENPYFDGIIVPKNEFTKDMVLSFTGADCVPIVGHAMSRSGQEFIFGMHAGRKGSLTGVIENTIQKLRELDIDFSTIQAVVGAGAQAIEIPVETLEKEVAQNPSDITKTLIGKTAMEMLDSSVVSVYSNINEHRHGNTQNATKALFDNQLDAALRLRICLGDNGTLFCVDANTITDDNFKSYRRQTMALQTGDKALADLKAGRNMTFVRF